jgi:hypothetical protein
MIFEYYEMCSTGLIREFDGNFNPKFSDCNALLLNEKKFTSEYIESMNKKIDKKMPLVATKFLLFSWDVGRPGTWFSIEAFFDRSQFHTRQRTMHTKEKFTIEYTPIVDNFRINLLESVFFQSHYSNSIYHGKIVAFGDYKRCDKRLREIEDHLICNELSVYDYMVPEARHCMLQYEHLSCRIEIINLQMNILKFFFPKRKREVDTHESDVQVNKRSKIE